MNENELSETLREWEPELPEEPGFQRSVWCRIEEGADRMSLSSFFRFIPDLMARPRIGIPVAALTVLFAAGLAVHNGLESRDALWHELSLFYENSIDPVRHVQLSQTR